MRRVLFISYYFPPAGGSGVQRGLKFVRYLPEYGFEPVVITVREDAAAYPDLDPSLQEELPADLHVIRTRSWDPYAWYARFSGSTKPEYKVGSLGGKPATFRERMARWVRANLFLPDARVAWIPFAKRAARNAVKRFHPDVVVTTGPPHSTHLVGQYVSRKFGIPWVADFRDLWTDINYYVELPQTRLAAVLDRRLERSIVTNADIVTTVSPYCRQKLDSVRNRHKDDVRVVYNGFDNADFETDFSKRVVSEHRTGFRISYVGTLSAGQDPPGLWSVLGRLFRNQKIAELELALTGKIDPSVHESIRAAGLDTVCTVEGYVSHREAIGRMQTASMLFFSIRDFSGAAGTLTGKLFEYMAAGRPILGIGPIDGDAARLLRETGTGDMVAQDDLEGMERIIVNLYGKWSRGMLPDQPPNEVVSKYSRQGQTKEFARILDELIVAKSKQPGIRSA